MKKTHILLIVMVFVAGVGAVYWTSSAGRVRTVDVIRVEYADLHQSIDTNGKIEAQRDFELRAPFAGICRTIHVREGALLAARQPVLEMDNVSVRADLSSANAELEAAESELRTIVRGPTAEELGLAEADVHRRELELDKAQKLLESNEWLLQRNAVSRFEAEASRREVQSARQALAAAIAYRDNMKGRYNEADRKRAQSRVQAARDRVEFLRTSLARSVVRAPASGTLYHFQIKDGAYVNTGDLLGVLADLSQLRVRAYVDEPDLGRVAPGAQIKVYWDAHPAEVWTGTVRHIPSEIVSRGSRSVAEVLCSIDNPKALIPNLNVDVQILAPGGAKAASLPRNAVFTEGEEQFVWIVKGARAARRAVETGRSTASRIEITAGLGVGDEVILGDDRIEEGARVRVDAQ
jgi:multidrug efflux pump subunit AcrA (membrane-fusion protein)